MEETQDQPHSLDALAALACMSKYHFLRSFRRITGSTPYDWLLSLRLRRAAVRLRESTDGIAAIAYDAGFGDLSTFNEIGRSACRARVGKYVEITVGAVS